LPTAGKNRGDSTSAVTRTPWPPRRSPVRERIAATAHALRRMSEGTYGRCEDCGKEIPLGRLRATPQATRCVRCERSVTPEPAAARAASSGPWRPAPPPAE